MTCPEVKKRRTVTTWIISIGLNTTIGSVAAEIRLLFQIEFGCLLVEVISREEIFKYTKCRE